MPSRSQQWDHNIAAKVAEFTGTFEKQALAFNIITRKRSLGEFRSEERLMIEQALLQEEKRLLLNLKAEMDAREKASREAQLRMAAMFQAEQAQAESHAHAEMMSRAPIRASALGSQGNSVPIGHDMGEQEHGVNPDEMMNGWGGNAPRDEKEPSEDFLNDEETENGNTAVHKVLAGKNADSRFLSSWDENDCMTPGKPVQSTLILMEKIGVSVYFLVPFLVLGYCRCVIRRLKTGTGSSLLVWNDECKGRFVAF
ncbi:hypothetical protein POTOM_058128 [Populus tomentosa]|uniref:GLTSCR protein conserved domain-containing protein n=1 Tax=Populus tomentosa TaxID=118781 RepID=A0A8X7XQX6_POPTO|nr:hypothetical protein POTOM_058128 [Populus tomentosa]